MKEQRGQKSRRKGYCLRRGGKQLGICGKSSNFTQLVSESLSPFSGQHSAINMTNVRSNIHWIMLNGATASSYQIPGKTGGLSRPLTRTHRHKHTHTRILIIHRSRTDCTNLPSSTLMHEMQAHTLTDKHTVHARKHTSYTHTYVI